MVTLSCVPSPRKGTTPSIGAFNRESLREMIVFKHLKCECVSLLQCNSGIYKCLNIHKLVFCIIIYENFREKILSDAVDLFFLIPNGFCSLVHKTKWPEK